MVAEQLIIDPGKYFTSMFSKNDEIDIPRLKAVIKTANDHASDLAKARLGLASSLLIDKDKDPSMKLATKEAFVRGGSLILYAVRFLPSRLGRNEAFRLVTAFGRDTSPLISPDNNPSTADIVLSEIIDTSRIETPSVVPFQTAFEVLGSQINQDDMQQARFAQAGVSITALTLNDLYKSGKF